MNVNILMTLKVYISAKHSVLRVLSKIIVPNLAAPWFFFNTQIYLITIFQYAYTFSTLFNKSPV